LHLPLSARKLTKADVQPIIDKVAARIPTWKANLLNRAGRTVACQGNPFGNPHSRHDCARPINLGPSSVLIKEDVLSFGVELNKFRAVTAFLLGRKFVAPVISVAWASQTWRFLDRR